MPEMTSIAINLPGPTVQPAGGYVFGRPGTEPMAKTVDTSEGPCPAFDTVRENKGESIALMGPFADVPVVVNAVRA